MITVDRTSRRHHRNAARIEETAYHYGAIAARKLGGTLPEVRILVTDGRDMVRVVCKAEAQLAGSSTRARRAINTAASWWHERHNFGATVYDETGLLVAINGDAHRGNLRALDRTTIHELTHTVQLNAPGARQQHATYTRMLLGAQRHDQKYIADYMRAMNVREQQAANLEILA